MKLIVDQKRRVVLPKCVKPGDALEVVSSGDLITLHVLRPVPFLVPPVSPDPLSGGAFCDVDFDEPAFAPLSHEGIA